MKKLTKAIAAGLLGLTLFAEDHQPNPSAQTAQSTVTEPIPIGTIDTFNKASSVIGLPVKDSSGHVLGKVQDLVFDLESNKLGYAVLDLGDKRMVPVPITALKRGESKDHFVLNMTSALLAAAPGIQNDAWPAVDTFAIGAPAQSETGRGKSSDENAP
jgi:hypothetical protein